MGLAGSFRSFNAALNSIERDERRRQRLLAQKEALMEKAEELLKAGYEVEKYNNLIDLLKSVHKECGNRWVWEDVKSSPPPVKPVQQNTNEVIAQKIVADYNPNLFEKLCRIDKRKRINLLRNLESAKEADKIEFDKTNEEFNKQYKEWQIFQNISAKILSKDLSGYIEAIKAVAPFQEIENLGSNIEFHIFNKDIIIATLQAQPKEIIPKETKSLLKSGKLSTKEMPISKFNELYQDYVCGCAIRIARESFALLPIKMIIINITENLLNTQTGYLKNKPILSVAIPKDTLFSLNIEAIDPSDSMRNFVHKMNFKKTEGFSSVENLNPSDFIKA